MYVRNILLRMDVQLIKKTVLHPIFRLQQNTLKSTHKKNKKKKQNEPS